MEQLEKTCDNCVSRLICPMRSTPCMGWNDEEVFWSLLKLPHMDLVDRIDDYRKFVVSLQSEYNGEG